MTNLPKTPENLPPALVPGQKMKKPGHSTRLFPAKNLWSAWQKMVAHNRLRPLKEGMPAPAKNISPTTTTKRRKYLSCRQCHVLGQPQGLVHIIMEEPVVPQNAVVVVQVEPGNMLLR